MNINYHVGLIAAGNLGYIYVNGVIVARTGHIYTNGANSGTSFSATLEAGDIITFGGSTSGDVTETVAISILSQVINEEIITASDIVSSETMSFTFKPASSGALDCTTDPIGTYASFSKPVNDNTGTQCEPAPDTPPTSLDGFYMWSVPYNNNSSCTGVASVTRYDICIAKGLKGLTFKGFTGAAKSGISVQIQKDAAGGNVSGLDYFYNPETGELQINSGISPTSATNTRFWRSTTGNSAGNYAYIHFYGSKNPVVNAMETIPRIDYSWENEFSATISNNGTCSVLSENQDFIDDCSFVSTGVVDINFNAGFFTQVPAFKCTAGVLSRQCAFNEAGITTSTVRVETSQAGGTAENGNFHIQVSRQGSDYKERGSAAAIIAQPTCFIKDVKPNGTNGGTSVTSSFVTRDLNTLEGQCDGISVSANVVTITEAGSWIIKALSPARGTDLTSLSWIKNPTGAGAGEEIFTGQSARCENNSFHNDCVVHLDSSFITTGSSTTFELQMYTSTNNGNAGISLGSYVLDGLPETYSVVKLTRIK